MKTVLLLALSLAFSGAALVAATGEALACDPPNCPTRCELETERAYLSDPIGPIGHVDVPTGYRCHY